MHIARLIGRTADDNVDVGHACLFTATIKRFHAQHERIRQVGGSLGVVARPRGLANENFDLSLACVSI